jgi:hypothetical protein
MDTTPFDEKKESYLSAPIGHSLPWRSRAIFGSNLAQRLSRGEARPRIRFFSSFGGAS